VNEKDEGGKKKGWAGVQGHSVKGKTIPIIEEGGEKTQAQKRKQGRGDNEGKKNVETTFPGKRERKTCKDTHWGRGWGVKAC